MSQLHILRVVYYKIKNCVTPIKITYMFLVMFTIKEIGFNRISSRYLISSRALWAYLGATFGGGLRWP